MRERQGKGALVRERKERSRKKRRGLIRAEIADRLKVAQSKAGRIR